MPGENGLPLKRLAPALTSVLEPLQRGVTEDRDYVPTAIVSLSPTVCQPKPKGARLHWFFAVIIGGTRSYGALEPPLPRGGARSPLRYTGPKSEPE